MKKRAMTFLAAILLTAGATYAQGQYPTVYSNMINDMAFPWTMNHVWDDVVNGKSGQGLGLVAPGAKKIVSTINLGEDYGGPQKWEHEFYPNGLTKSDDALNGKHTYNYDKQWRLQNITGNNGEVEYKYIYNQQQQLVKCLYSGGVTDEYDYTYGTDKKLKTITKSGYETYSFTNEQLVKITYKSDNQTWPMTLIYDPQGRWKGYTSIVEDGMDEVFIFKTQITLNYTGTNPLPTSVTKSIVEYDPKRKTNIGKPEVTTFRCTYTFDSKGNWTSWKATGGYGGWHITRTITYYTDEEVKAATAELEQARKGTTQDNGQKKEDLWEF